MQTRFTPEQRADPDIALADGILRACTHCGFCNASCPTYGVLGDERDGPRGRIYLMKSLFEDATTPVAGVAPHLDRCLSCLSCMTTCPAGVDYRHLVDLARARVEKLDGHPPGRRILRRLIVAIFAHPVRLRWALRAARIALPLRRFLPRGLGAALDQVPRRLPRGETLLARRSTRRFPAAAPHRGRVALLAGCVQQTIAPHINDASIRLLTRLGYEVVIAHEAGCCGALAHHLGQESHSAAAARANVAAWHAAWEGEGLDAVVVNVSGCGSVVKDYGFILRHDPDYGEKAARISALTRDIAEFVEQSGEIPDMRRLGLKIAYQAPCSLRHGQRIDEAPRNLLHQAFRVVEEPAEAHLCCGSAGTYSLLQSDMAQTLRAKKLAALDALKPDVVASGNVGCIAYLAAGSRTPVVHTVELLDWATGGPMPPALAPRVR